MRRVICSLIFAILVLALGNGCTGSSRDVSSDPVFRNAGGYKVGEVYQLRADAVIVETQNDYWKTGVECYFVEPKYVSDFATYRPADRVLGKVNVGTRLRLVKVIAFHCNPKPFYWWDRIRPIALILDGPYAGRRVDIRDFSGHAGSLPNVELATSSADTVRPVAAASTHP